MKKYSKVRVQSYKGARKYAWAVKMFFIAISMSLFFGFISQTLLTELGAIIGSVGICLFIFFAVLFDMLGIASAMADLSTFEKWEKEGRRGSAVGVKICKNAEKVCAFCADVVGDICSTLCGAGGACIVSALSQNVASANAIIFISISVSALIAGITIFFKAIMKERALKNADKIILRLGIILECTIFKEKVKNDEKT